MQPSERKHIFIVNPKAGKRDSTEFVRDQIARLGDDYACEVYITECEGDAIRYVKERCRCENDTLLRFYACGGDGTLNEVVTGAVGNNNVEVSCLPVGSGNDYVKYYGGAEGFLDIRRLVDGDVREVDVMRVGDRYSINVCNFGFDAVVCRTMTEVRRKPVIGGRNAYTTGILKALFVGRRTPCRISVDGKVVNDGEILLCTMGNGRYVGGAYMCSPLSKNDDGQIEICMFRPMTILNFARLIGSYRDGTFIHRDDVQDKMVYLRGKSIDIEAPDEIDVCVDGEIVRNKKFHIEQMPKAIRFVAPK